jgi:hypothetical protein
MNKSRNLFAVALLCIPLTHSMYAMDKFDYVRYGKIPMHIETYRTTQWADYREHGNPNNTDAIATHDHIVEALTLIHKPCDSLIQRHNYWEIKPFQKMEHESMKYVTLLKEDFDKRTENFSALDSRFNTYRSNFDDFVMAVGYKQLIEKRMEQDEKSDNFHYWQLRDYVRALESRISAHNSWLRVARDTGEEHYGFLHRWGHSREVAENLNKFRTDDPKVREYCWEQFFKEKLCYGLLEHWKSSYVSNREDTIARMLSPKSVAYIQAFINRGFEAKAPSSSAEESNVLRQAQDGRNDEDDSEGASENIEPNNLLLGINGWK